MRHIRQFAYTHAHTYAHVCTYTYIGKDVARVREPRDTHDGRMMKTRIPSESLVACVQLHCCCDPVNMCRVGTLTSFITLWSAIKKKIYKNAGINLVKL